MKKYNDLKKVVEAAFSALEIKFELMDFDDGDLNYSISLPMIGKLKPLNTIDCIIYFSEEDYTMNFFVANIYNIAENCNLFNLLKIINEQNIETSIGNYTVNDFDDAGKQIVYRGKNFCGKDFANFDSDIIVTQVLVFISTLQHLLRRIKETVESDEKKE